MKILVTGGAGFVGSNLSLMLKQTNPHKIIALDNLKRKGSELALPRLKNAHIDFIHGDIRNPEDLDSAGDIDLIIECSAEPSVKAGYNEDPRYVINTNLNGTINCLEFARKNQACMIFLSTSRVYPISPMRALPLKESTTRLIIPDEKYGTGWSSIGITEDFLLTGFRSLYGATKLSSEHIIEEYANMYGLKTIINRCGVLAGPWQMGKIDQGFVSLWVARHFFNNALSYTGFGGKGLQVRDMLHIKDLFDLVLLQIENIDKYNGETFNVGGGFDNSVSLKEMTDRCKKLTGVSLNINSDPDTHPSDIPFYISDNTKVCKKTGWSPKRSVDEILDDVFKWLKDNRIQLEGVLNE